MFSDISVEYLAAILAANQGDLWETIDVLQEFKVMLLFNCLGYMILKLASSFESIPFVDVLLFASRNCDLFACLFMPSFFLSALEHSFQS